MASNADSTAGGGDKLTPRNIRALENKKRIVETARRLVDERGYENVTVNDIVAECGLTKGAFYYHFKSKSDVVFQLDRGRFNDLYDETEQSALSDPLDRMTLYVRTWHKYLDEDSRHFSQYWMRYNLNPDHRHASYGNSSAFAMDYEYLSRYFAEAVEKGCLKPGAPVDMLAKMVAYCMYGSYCEKCLSDDSPATAPLAEQMLDHLFNVGLAPYYADGYVHRFAKAEV